MQARNPDAKKTATWAHSAGWSGLEKAELKTRGVHAGRFRMSVLHWHNHGCHPAGGHGKLVGRKPA